MKKLTKAQTQMLNNYLSSNMYRLSDLYKNYSCEKAYAERNILNEMSNKSGYGFKICGGNFFFFTCAYCYDTNENGNINKHLVYHTPYRKIDFVFDVE